MQAYLHGGACCGIKHIAGFSALPSSPMGKLLPYNVNNAELGVKMPAFRGEAPTETCLKRFQRLVEFCRKQPNGITEVILADNHVYTDCGHQQTKAWGKAVLAEGFVEVSSCYNSNSGNIITVYHLIRDDKSKRSVVRKKAYPCGL